MLSFLPFIDPGPSWAIPAFSLKRIFIEKTRHFEETNQNPYLAEFCLKIGTDVFYQENCRDFLNCGPLFDCNQGVPNIFWDTIRLLSPTALWDLIVIWSYCIKISASLKSLFKMQFIDIEHIIPPKYTRPVGNVHWTLASPDLGTGSECRSNVP